MRGQSKWLGRLPTASVFEYVVAMEVDAVPFVQYFEAMIGMSESRGLDVEQVCRG